MGFTSTFFGQGQFPYTTSYEGSTYVTQAYTNPPEYKSSLSMTTQFSNAINGNTVALAEYNSTLFTGEAVGLWIYRLYFDGQLVGIYQMCDQQFSFPVTFDRVEGFCMGVPLTPAIPYRGTPEPEPSPPIPSPASIAILICYTFFSLRKNPRNA
jgi:hypothetical protein